MNKLFRSSSAAKLGLLIVVTLLVIGCRFCWGTPAGGIWFQTFLGYYFVLTLLTIWLTFFVQAGLREGWFRAGFWGRHSSAFLTIVGISLFLHVHEPHVMRVQYDEPTHALGALVMHLDKHAVMAGQSNYVGDAFILTQYHASFRQYLFSLLVSLLHDFTGYRWTNVFILNGLLTPFVLLNAYFLSYKLGGQLAGLVSVALLGTLPLLAQVVTSGEYDVLNLVLVGALILSTVSYVQAPEQERRPWLNLSLATVLLLAVSRAESILYVIPWVLVTLVLWCRTRRVELTGFAVLSPLFLLPNLMTNLFVAATGLGAAAEMRKAGEAVFDIAYLPKHLGEAVYYFFNFDRGSTNNVLLSGLAAVGLIAFAVYLVGAIRGKTARPVESIVALFMLWTGAMYTFILTHFWSSPVDGMAARFCLPLMFVGAVGAGWFVVQFRTMKCHPIGVCIGLVLWGALSAAPSMSRALITHGMTSGRAEEWYLDYAETKDVKTTLFVARSNVSFVVRRYASSGLEYLGGAPEKFVRALKAGLYNEIIVFQSLQPDIKTGVWEVSATDRLPANITLQTLDERLFSPDYKARVSRFVGFKRADGTLIVPTSDVPEIEFKKSFADRAEWYAYFLSLYP